MASHLQANAARVPLSERATSELLARAAELRRMAVTATTADTRNALESLAERFATLAEKRAAEERSREPER